MSYYNGNKHPNGLDITNISLQVFKIATATLLLIGFMAWITGCASQAELKLAYDAQNKNTKAQADRKQQPICAFTCGTVENPCQKVDLKCYTEQPPVIITRVTGTNDVIMSVIRDVAPVVTTGLIWGFGSKMVSDVVDGMGSNNTTTHNTSSVIGDDNQTDTSSSMSTSATSSATTTGDQANNNIAEANDNRGDSNDNNQANPVTTTNTDSNDQNNPVNTDDNSNQNNPISNLIAP